MQMLLWYPLLFIKSGQMQAVPYSPSEWYNIATAIIGECPSFREQYSGSATVEGQLYAASNDQKILYNGSNFGCRDPAASLTWPIGIPVRGSLNCISLAIRNGVEAPHQFLTPPPVPQLSILKSLDLPSRSTTVLKTASAAGLRQIFPVSSFNPWALTFESTCLAFSL